MAQATRRQGESDIHKELSAIPVRADQTTHTAEFSTKNRIRVALEWWQ